MCGLVGMAGNINHNEKQMFRDMLIFDQVRGFDSCGVAKVPLALNDEPSIVKDTFCPRDLFEVNPKFFDSSGVVSGSVKVLIGHNRAATKGKVSEENAHPFEFGDIVGAHNGSLHDYSELEGSNKHEVDSQALFQTISDKGIEHCWKSFRGAAALTFYDKDKKELHLIRNSQRPLYAVKNLSGNCLFWASEKWMLTVAAGRNKVNLDIGEDKKGIILLKPNSLHTFLPESMSCKLKEVKELQEKKYQTTTSGTNLGTRGVGSNYRGRSSFKSSGKRKHQINGGWAKKLEKASKDYRGTLISLREGFIINQCTNNDPIKCYIVGELQETKEKIHIIPNSEEDKTEIRRHFRSNTLYVCKDRPRYREKNQLGKIEKVLAIGSLGVKKYIPKSAISNVPVVTKNNNVIDLKPKTDFVEVFDDKDKEYEVPFREYKSFGTKVTKEIWEYRLNQLIPKGCCSFCSQTLSIEDHDKYVWPSVAEVLCEKCSHDPDVQFYRIGALH